MSEQEYYMMDEVNDRRVKVKAFSLKEAEEKFDKYLDLMDLGEEPDTEQE